MFPVLGVAVLFAYAASTYASHYGVLGALVTGLSVGAGFLFSYGLLGITEKWKNARILSLGILVAVSWVLIAVLFPLSQQKAGGMYYLNFTGLLAGIPFVFSVVALLHTVILTAMGRKGEPQRYRNSQP